MTWRELALTGEAFRRGFLGKPLREKKKRKSKKKKKRFKNSWEKEE